jgi:hypothetical protein
MTTDEVAARRRWFTSGRDGRTRLERWELTFDETLIAAAVVFIVTYALPILWRRAPAWVVTSCNLGGKVICAGIGWTRSPSPCPCSGRCGPCAR